jgi:hypothetical protein
VVPNTLKVTLGAASIAPTSWASSPQMYDFPVRSHQHFSILLTQLLTSAIAQSEMSDLTQEAA